MSNNYSKNENGIDDESEVEIINPIRQVEIIKNAVQAVIDNLSTVEAAKVEAGKIEGGQLAILQNALKDFPEPVTEEIWDSLFKANVRDLLAGAEVNGSKRYANPSSRDVMTNNFKVATMGLTLAKQDIAFAPWAPGMKGTATNLKKYAAAVRPMLQAAIDPVTGKPRLKSIATTDKPKDPKSLSNDTYYYLIGSEDEGAETAADGQILARKHVFRDLKRDAEKWAGEFSTFFYIAGKMERLPMEPKADEEHEIVIKTVATSSTHEAA